MIALDCKKVNDLATLLGVTPQNLNGYIDRGTFIKLASPELYKRNINIDWVKTGHGNMTVEQETNNHLREVQPPYNGIPPTPYHSIKISDLISQTAAILESDTVFKDALKSNIVAFYFGMNLSKDLNAAKGLLRQHEALLKQQKQTIDNQADKLSEQEERLKAVEAKLLTANDE